MSSFGKNKLQVEKDEKQAMYLNLPNVPHTSLDAMFVKLNQDQASNFPLNNKNFGQQIYQAFHTHSNHLQNCYKGEPELEFHESKQSHS